MIARWILAAVAAATLVLSAAPARAEGKKLFEQKCSICHGENGVPKKAAGKAHRFKDQRWQQTITREQIEKIITEGREANGKKMPPFKDELAPEQITAIASHVKSMK